MSEEDAHANTVIASEYGLNGIFKKKKNLAKLGLALTTAQRFANWSDSGYGAAGASTPGKTSTTSLQHATRGQNAVKQYASGKSTGKQNDANETHSERDVDDSIYGEEPVFDRDLWGFQQGLDRYKQVYETFSKMNVSLLATEGASYVQSMCEKAGIVTSQKLSDTIAQCHAETENFSAEQKHECAITMTKFKDTQNKNTAWASSFGVMAILLFYLIKNKKQLSENILRRLKLWDDKDTLEQTIVKVQAVQAAHSNPEGIHLLQEMIDTTAYFYGGLRIYSKKEMVDL